MITKVDTPLIPMEYTIEFLKLPWNVLLAQMHLDTLMFMMIGYHFMVRTECGVQTCILILKRIYHDYSCGCLFVRHLLVYCTIREYCDCDLDASPTPQGIFYLSGSWNLE